MQASSFVSWRTIDPILTPWVGHLRHLVALKLAAAVDVKPIEGLSMRWKHSFRDQRSFLSLSISPNS
jgi:hypothetical protein